MNQFGFIKNRNRKNPTFAQAFAGLHFGRKEHVPKGKRRQRTSGEREEEMFGLVQ